MRSLIAVFALASITESALPFESPNFILVVLDDSGYGDLGTTWNLDSAQGNRSNTPSIDALASRGLQFTDFSAVASICTPSRAALLTGRYGLRTGIVRHISPFSTSGLPQSEITIAKALKHLGYRTAMIGKWHLGHTRSHQPTSHGFDHYLGIPYSNDMGCTNHNTVKQPLGLPRHVAKPCSRATRVPPLPLYHNGQIVESPTNLWTLTEKMTKFAEAFLLDNKEEEGGSEEDEDGSVGPWVEGRPFFLYAALTEPHVPHTPRAVLATSTSTSSSRKGEARGLSSTSTAKSSSSSIGSSSSSGSKTSRRQLLSSPMRRRRKSQITDGSGSISISSNDVNDMEYNKAGSGKEEEAGVKEAGAGAAVSPRVASRSRRRSTGGARMQTHSQQQQAAQPAIELEKDDKELKLQPQFENEAKAAEHHYGTVTEAAGEVYALVMAQADEVVGRLCEASAMAAKARRQRRISWLKRKIEAKKNNKGTTKETTGVAKQRQLGEIAAGNNAGKEEVGEQGEEETELNELFHMRNEEERSGVGELCGGEEANTLTIVTSDNGPWREMGRYGGHAGPFNGGKFSSMEGGLRVYAVFHWPGKILARDPSSPAATAAAIDARLLFRGSAAASVRLLGGRRSYALASALDLFPTILDLAVGGVENRGKKGGEGRKGAAARRGGGSGGVSGTTLQKQQLLTGLSLNILDGVSLVPILLHQDPCEEHYQIRDHLWLQHISSGDLGPLRLGHFKVLGGGGSSKGYQGQGPNGVIVHDLSLHPSETKPFDWSSPSASSSSSHQQGHHLLHGVPLVDPAAVARELKQRSSNMDFGLEKHQQKQQQQQQNQRQQQHGSLQENTGPSLVAMNRSSVAVLAQLLLAGIQASILDEKRAIKKKPGKGP